MPAQPGRHCIPAHFPMKIIIAATMKPYIATTIAIAVLCNSALANFIDPSKPTIQDEADEWALYRAGLHILLFYHSIWITHEGVSGDQLDYNFAVEARAKYPNDPQLQERFFYAAKAYFRMIFTEVGDNRQSAATPEEKAEVYVKTRDWLINRTGRSVPKRYMTDTPPPLVRK
jgi:hypothetical protein